MKKNYKLGFAKHEFEPQFTAAFFYAMGIYDQLGWNFVANAYFFLMLLGP
jgi:hypothetical protein